MHAPAIGPGLVADRLDRLYVDISGKLGQILPYPIRPDVTGHLMGRRRPHVAGIFALPQLEIVGRQIDRQRIPWKDADLEDHIAALVEFLSEQALHLTRCDVGRADGEVAGCLLRGIVVD